jgi:hypothetical protein
MRGGLQPDLLNDAGWWQTRLWIYAVYAAVIYRRAAADRRRTTLEQVAHDLAARHGLVEDVEAHIRSDDSVRSSGRWLTLAGAAQKEHRLRSPAQGDLR